MCRPNMWLRQRGNDLWVVLNKWGTFFDQHKVQQIGLMEQLLILVNSQDMQLGQRNFSETWILPSERLLRERERERERDGDAIEKDKQT